MENNSYICVILIFKCFIKYALLTFIPILNKLIKYIGIFLDSVYPMSRGQGFPPNITKQFSGQ